MSTAILPSEARRNVALFMMADRLSIKPKMRFERRTFNGNEIDALIVEGVPVFRTGTFRDSMGFQHTWESLHLDQMVAHFDLLRSREIFADVPVRRGHGALFSDSIDNVIGWHAGLRRELRTNRVDGKEYDFLLADYEILDSDAIVKISSGLWRNLSAEVGPYLTNDEAEFWPVYVGVAYVDIPAVEGLKNHSRYRDIGKTFSVFLPNHEKEAPVGTENDNGHQGNSTPPQPQPDPAAFSRSQFVFRIGGQQTQDFAAVQAHIDSLEAAQDEARKANRSAFIKGLAEGDSPKILAGQIEKILGYAMNLDDAGWRSFAESWESAAPLPHTSDHGKAEQVPGASTPGGNPSPSAEPSEKDTLAAIVLQHKRGNMPRKALESTASFQKLKALDPTHPALAA